MRALADVIAAPPAALTKRLSILLAPFAAHDALVVLAADADGGRRMGTGDPSLLRGLSFLDLDARRRRLAPGTARRGATEAAPTLELLSRNGALLVLAGCGDRSADAATVLQLWNLAATRVQRFADAAAPDYLQRARHAAAARTQVLDELVDEYSTVIESILTALRSPALPDSVARETATRLAGDGIVHMHTVADRIRIFGEESLADAFRRLRDELRPLVRFAELEVQFVEPREATGMLPGEVAYGVRAAVRGVLQGLLERPDIRRVRVEWSVDGADLIVDVRDDGGERPAEPSMQMTYVVQRVRALSGALHVDTTPGWGTRLSIVVPVDAVPDPAAAAIASTRDLRPREAEVLELLTEGLANRDIAARLGISENTVKFHLSRIYRALEVSNRAQAVAVSRR